jgi:hypothetical protein
MKKNIIRSVKLLTLLSLLFFGAYSCVDDSLSDLEIRRIIEEEIRKNNQNLEFTQWEIVPITVRETDWKWFDDVGRYEAVYDLPELTEFIYESGAQIGYVFIGEQGKNEVQKSLPYVHTYYQEDNLGNPILYTETISCDYQYGSPSTVAFYIQGSDLGRDDSILADYNFRIVLIW